MTVKDDLLKLKTLTSTPVTATENGWTTETRDATTGQIVIQVNKCPVEGIPIEIIYTVDTGTENGAGTMIVTIEASDTLASGYITVATFPTITQATAMRPAGRMVRRVATQKKYLRSVITVVATNSPSRYFTINVGIGLVDDDSVY